MAATTWRRVPLLALLLGACATARVPEPERLPDEPPPERPAEPPRPASMRIGVIVSSSGSPVLQQYGELVLQGVQLGASAEQTAQRTVDVIVRDDGGTAAGAARAVRELEQAGVQVIIGPLTDEALVAAARARVSDGVVLISPTAVREPTELRNVFALNVVDTRGATALGEYARRFARVGVLHARTPGGMRQARAFVDAYSRGGHGFLREAPFDSGATNVSAQLTRLREARIDALFFPGSERELQIVLPQIEYFGMGRVQMFGTESWLSDASYGLPPRVLDNAILATPLWRESNDVAWREFVQQYEARYRRSLDHPMPALGFDAARLAVNVLAAGRPAVADHRGATGVLTLQSDSVTRRPFLVRLQNGRLVPVN